MVSVRREVHMYNVYIYIYIRIGLSQSRTTTILAEKEVGALDRNMYKYISMSYKYALGRKILCDVFSVRVFSRDSHRALRLISHLRT